jgi:uncharacterized protein (TIGR02452 family)
MTRGERAKIGQQTLDILREGFYLAPGGHKVELSASIQASVQATRIVRPHEWTDLHGRLQPSKFPKRAKIEVTSETTLAALHRLVVQHGAEHVAALNFASAKNPGGGFLGGSQAQEESLARSSGLFATLERAQEYYDENRRCRSVIYTDHAIYSPRVPIFRDDSGLLLEQPYLASFITMPAVNTGAIRHGSPELQRVAEVMERRIRCVLALAATTGSRELVLGAWGCGVFRNDPAMIASLFATVLGENHWHSHFDRIVFAVFDPSPEGVNRQPFDRHFPG